VQGTAAELTKESLVRIWEWEQVNRSGLLLCQTIHDEIAMDIPAKHARDVVRAVVTCMESYPQFAPVPILTDAEYSTTDWSEKKKFPKEWVAHVWTIPARA
jgi:DNA polymerase I-like protein with 3'-5' exonuclease and polymerase domains